MENEIVIVDGTPVFGKNIGNVKLFRTKAVLAYLHGPVYDFTNTHFEINNPIPVYDSDNRHLGYANVALLTSGNNYPNRLVADMSIDYACEERLLTETKQEKYYPKMFGVVRTAVSDFDFTETVKVSFVTINGIVLTKNQPKDKNIPAFGDVVL